METQIEASWRAALAEEFAKPYFAKLKAFVDDAYFRETVYPPREKIFAAFSRTPFDRVKVVILGQDPYHEPGQAQGLAFYVPPTIAMPPSLANIAKELAKENFSSDDLLAWCDQGVLLLNATLTVAAHRALSHQKKGWEELTDAAIRALAKNRENLVFILWGKNAQKKGAFIDRSRHCVIESAHPSPLSAYRGFFGSRPFTRANDYLLAHQQSAITW